MPEVETKPPTETATALAGELKSKTDAAMASIQGGGFNDPDFAASLQAAIDKDSGKEPARPSAELDNGEVDAAAKVTAEAKIAADKAAAEKTKVKIDDGLPAALFGEKPADKPTAEASEADRAKFIEEQTKGMTPKAADRFKKIEARAHEAEQKAKKLEQDRTAEKTALEKQIEELNFKAATKADDAEIAKLRKQIEDLDAIVAKAAIQEHPRFKAAYDGQIAAEIEGAKQLVPKENADELAELMTLPVSKRRYERIKELIDNLDDLDKLKVWDSVKDVDKLSAAKAKELANWRENQVHVEAEALKQRETQAINTQELYKVAWSKGMTEMASPEKGMEIFRKVDGEDEWNALVDARVQQVQKLLLNQNRPPEELVMIGAKAIAADEYRKMFLNQRTLVLKLMEELASLKSAAPNAADTGGDGGAGIEDTDDFVTAVTKGAIKAGGIKG